MSKEKKEFYTTDTITDNEYKISDFKDTNYSSIFKSYCQYLVPCGICERTGQQCPKHQDISWYKEWACETNNNKLKTSYTTDGEGTSRQDLEDFWYNK